MSACDSTTGTLPRLGRPAGAATATLEPAAPGASASDARCPRHGTEALGWWHLDRKGLPEIGERLRVRRTAPVVEGRGSGQDLRLAEAARCHLDRGQKLEVRTAPVELADGTVLVEVFPAAISGG